MKHRSVAPRVLLIFLFSASACASWGLPTLSYYGDLRGAAGGTRNGPHAGVDFGAPYGTPVLAGADGKVMYITIGLTGCGIGVLLEHSPKLYTVSCHLERHVVQLGQKVKRGEIIGYVGTSGNAAGVSHVHWQVCQYPCPWGNSSGDLDGTIDPLKMTAGCFDPQKTFPSDKLTLTYPLKC